MSDPAPSEPSPYEKMRALAKRVLSVPKSEIDKRDAEWRKQQALKRSKKK